MNETFQAHATSPILRALAAIAYDAGAILLGHYAEGVKVREKADASPVTIADEEAERFILKRLATLAPDVPVIAEEAVAAGRIPKIGRRFFLVDPLDGTKEFIKRNGEFTVNIAEIIDGKPVRGVVYAPAINKLYMGELSCGAFQIIAQPGGAPNFAEAMPIAVRLPAKDGVVMAISRSHADKKSEEYMAAFNVKRTVVAGSSLKFCLVAAGEADIYPRFGRTCEWDTAAGHAVLLAAGGSMTTPEGKPFLYGKTDEKYFNPSFIARGLE
ncbi:MAG: 3'(2'),5'-bisphosphate nucleotidase CysQ [Rhizomicrobium sp.]